MEDDIKIISTNTDCTVVKLALQQSLQKSIQALQSNPKNNIVKKEKTDCTASYTVKSTLANLSKITNFHYKNAIKRRKEDEHQWREVKVLRRMRQTYSVSDYKDFFRSYCRASSFERRDVMIQMQKKLGL
jgi:hypothetical protein